MGYHGEPFRWDEVRRAQLRAELDAYYARLYGLTRDELRYTPYGVDHKKVRREEFPGEKFRVLKEKEIRLNIMPQESLIRCLRKLLYRLEEESNDVVSSVDRIS